MTIVHEHHAKVDVRNILEKFYPDREFLGRGSYAQVWSWKKGVIKLQTYGDAYGEYLRWVIKHQDNPYVPRVYRTDLWKHNKAILIVYMEKLDKVGNVDGGIKICDSIRNYMLDRDKEILRTQPKEHLSHLRTLNNAINRLGSKYCFDLHGENIMLREEKENYIPVLTDPVA